MQVFVCHSSGDKSSVRELCRRLAAEGYEPWLDEQRLLPGQDWQLEIPKAIQQSQAVLVCLSRESASKEGYLQKEIKYALDVVDEKPEGAIFLIPVRLEECEIPRRLQRWQWANLYEQGGYERLVLALGTRARSIRRADPAVEEPARRLRSEGGTVSAARAKAAIVMNDFYCRGWNEGGGRARRPYETRVLEDDLVVVDRSAGLMWQRGGSGREYFTFRKAAEYARGLSYAGFQDWRVPSLEEAMSLMTAEENGVPGEVILGSERVKGVMHLDRTFETWAAPFIWTADLADSPGRGWVVYFWDGKCVTESVDFNATVKAVRLL
jgi:hypothetical protein